MSWRDCPEAACHETHGAVLHVLSPHEKDIGDFSVRRVLPAVDRRSVGPFVFFDHMGPAEFEPGKGISVRPHPHIGLATMTYLFEGEILHHDSLGYHQAIRPGAVNWMTAGRGIVHSERTSPEQLMRKRKLHGIQIWLALPLEYEEMDPAFQHVPREQLPQFRVDDAELRLIAGKAFGHPAPFETVVDLHYLEAWIDAEGSLTLPAELGERAVYVVEGEVTTDGTKVLPNQMAVLQDGASLTLEAGTARAHVMLAGGAPLDGKRHLWWNFVSSSRDRIEQAKDDWRNQRFGLVSGDEEEFIPLPE